ncbi:MAG: exodeoxyribonuclease VII large subunit [Chloroflexi bacterium]|nr:exodeoxyribonuclease VII large subunit [Chloroflexota bacterium]
MPPEVYPVRQVTRYLRELIEANRHLSDIWISGEVSNLTRASSGHVYFTLGDGGAALRCVLFRSRNVGQGQRIAEGISVVVYGSLSLYEQRGDLSFIVDFVQPEGVGALAAEFERLRAKFEEEGLLAPERKRPLPAFPQRVGLVTSPTGAVLHDVTDVLGRRWPLARLVVAPARVQGEGASGLIADALRRLGEEHLDAIILARGGGAAEDLWPFNEEPVSRAIYASPVPVISAVGHETDTTLADLVADVRAPTPSAAAELVAPDRAEVSQRVGVLARHADTAMSRRLDAATTRTERSATALAAGLPDLAAASRRIEERAAAGGRALELAIARAGERTGALGGRLAALSPLATLDRGYAVVTREDGSVVTSAAALRPDDAVQLRLRDGTRSARITG